MAKHAQDYKTLELPGLPAPTRRGRPAMGERNDTCGAQALITQVGPTARRGE